ncbi:MAG TPA: Pvc16 family protein [Myxococcales bacterium]|jgi:hypothetical protein
MIEDADCRVTAFVGQAAAHATIWLDPPAPDEKRTGIGLYLLEIAEGRAPREVSPAPMQVDLRYLVTAWAATPADEHKLLSDVALAALGREDVTSVFRTIDPALWAGFRIPPRAAFFLQVPVRLERSQTRGPPVRETHTQVVPMEP